STIASVETTETPPPTATTEASSPSQRATRPPRRPSAAPIAWIRARSSNSAARQPALERGSDAGATGHLAVPVDDARAVEVVGRQLAAHAVARKDPDAKAPHLAGDVTEHDVVVVELHAEHRVGQGLDHLALELDLVFL